jgi:N-acetylneuraminic acid mutarotase
LRLPCHKPAARASRITGSNLEPRGTIPSSRFGEALVYFSDTGKLLTFGGASDEKNPLDDTWLYDPGKNTWTNLKPSGDLPSGRRAMASTYDPAANKVVIFGGQGAAGDLLNETWAYDV